MRRFIVALFLAVLALPVLGTTALAHERRTIGPYQFVVGWINEPAYVGQLNAVDLTVTDTTKNNAPVEGLDKTLKAEVFYGGLTGALTVAFRMRFGQPGKYAADAVPTRVGTYTFHIFGKIGSMDINERFESGPGRFGDVEDTASLQYPDVVASGAELGDRLSAIQSGVDQLRIIAISALVLGVAAIGISAWRRRA